MTSTRTSGFTDRRGGRSTRKAAARLRKQLEKTQSPTARSGPDLPMLWGSAAGERVPHNLRGPASVTPPVHRASSTTLGIALPFLTETGEAWGGAFVGENLLSRGMFSWDPWLAYSMGIIRSHSMGIIGVKGSGKSMLSKSLGCRLIRLGRQVAVPHDPNGEWTRVADYVDGTTISVGPGGFHRINPLDPGLKPSGMSDSVWAYETLRYQSQKIQAMVKILRGTTKLPDEEHTVIDLVLASVRERNAEILLPAVWEELRNPTGPHADEIRADGVSLQHTLRRVIVGDVAGMFDKPSTVHFDATTPMVTVDTSRLESASGEAKALVRLTTTDWIKRSAPTTADQARVVIHEEAAVALLTEIASGSGLAERAAEEKTARHRGAANWYVLHRIADLDALGDRGSAMHSQALGLLADCETRVNYAQHAGELDRSAEVLGWNTTQRELVRRLGNGEGFWQIGETHVAKVRNVCTPGEKEVFRTDIHGGARK